MEESFQNIRDGDKRRQRNASLRFFKEPKLILNFVAKMKLRKGKHLLLMHRKNAYFAK